MSIYGLSLVGLGKDCLWAIERIRQIRNEGRVWMTEDVSEITPEQQLEWWEKSNHLPRSDFDLVPFFPFTSDPNKNDVVGYGMLMRRLGVLHISLAVDSKHRGRGYGTLIYSAMWNRVDEPVYAVILKNNFASIKAAEKAGFKFQENGDKTVLYMRAK